MIRKILTKNQLEDVKKASTQWNVSLFEYYGYLYGLDKRNQYLIHEINENYENDLIISYWENDEIIGFFILQHMDWESKMFNYNIGKLVQFCHAPSLTTTKVDKLMLDVKNYAKELKYDMVYIKLNTQNASLIRAFCRIKAHLVDTSLDFVFDLNKSIPEQLNPKVKIEEAQQTDKEECVRLMNLSFKNHFGRFNADAKLVEGAKDIYSNWISSCFDGYADSVLVGKIDGIIAGITVWKNNSTIENKLNIPMGHYSIGAVHPDFFGQKVFQDLTSVGLKKLKKQGLSHVEGPTNISNYPVQNAYATMGWRNLSSKHCFHLWLK